MAVGLAGAEPAAAHNLSRSPVAGDVNTHFVLRGTAWQPNGLVRWSYYRSTRAKSPSRQGTFRLRNGGTFTFTWKDASVGASHWLCFSQSDTRFGKTFRKCANFYVEGPHAWFQPSSGKQGDSFLLIVHGFVAGRRVNGTLQLPDGSTQTFGGVVATRGHFADGGPFGPVWIPRGGGFQVFTTSATAPTGTTLAVVRQGSLVTRAVAQLTAG